MLRCHAILQELHISESVFKPQSPDTDAALHHMIAALACCINKHLLSLGRKDLYPLISDQSKALLLATMPGMQREAAVGGGGAQSHQPATGHDPSMSSHVTMSSGGSGLPSSFHKVSKNSKKTRKQTMASSEQPTESIKSAEYRAFEGVVMMGVGGLESESTSSLTGQEDPMVLHSIIVSMPSQVAYREGQCVCTCTCSIYAIGVLQVK